MKLTDKFVPFFAVTPNKKFLKLFKRAGVKNVLISYHYVRTNFELTKQFMDYVRSVGGLFMVDSGIFTFKIEDSFDENEFDWDSYIEEYVGWVRANKDFIFSACNVDAEMFFPPRIIDAWNEHYFEPLSKEVNVIYIAHRNAYTVGDDGIKRFKYYCSKYDYVGVSEEFKANVQQLYQIAKKTKTAVHGLAWTKPTILSDYPFTSVDSSSWVGYQKYGSTVWWDGKNFNQVDNKEKDVRKTLKRYCKKYDIRFDEYVTEKNPDGSHNDDEGLTFSLKAWIEALNSIRKVALRKLRVTIEDLIKGKAMEEYVKHLDSDMQDAVSKSLDDLIGEQDNEKQNAEVAIYKKRSEELVNIDDFRQDMGSALFCDNCVVADTCPKAKPGNSCAFNFTPAKIASNGNTPIAVIDFLIEKQAERVQKALFVEALEGGAPNKVYTQEMRALQELANTKAKMLIDANTKRLTVKQEITATDPSGNEGGGGFMSLLSKMMTEDNK
jgi:hypothetical protein